MAELAKYRDQGGKRFPKTEELRISEMTRESQKNVLFVGLTKSTFRTLPLKSQVVLAYTPRYSVQTSHSTTHEKV